MPKRIFIFNDTFKNRLVAAYYAKTTLGYRYTLKDLQKKYKVSEWTLRKICKEFELRRNKRGVKNG
mgnify:CR=1 FL=1